MVLTLDPPKYRKLLSRALPKRIETDEEFDRFVEIMEGLSRTIEHGRATAEERTLHSLLALVVREYDDRVQLPAGDPLRILHYLMEQRGLRNVDMVPIFGSRPIASMVLNGKRDLSKAHIRKLADFFKVSPELFL